MAGCGGAPPVPGPADMATVQPGDFSVEGRDLPPPATPTTALVATALQGAGALATVRLADRTVTPSVDGTLSADVTLRCDVGRCLVLDRAQSMLRLYEPAKGFASP